MTRTESSSLLPVYARADLVMARGDGAYLFDVEGARYLDFAAGIAVNALGHNHPHLVAALMRQAGLLWHCSNLYATPELTRFADRLVAASFADKVFFTNSGSEAVECAIKIMRRHHAAAGKARPRVITVTGAFHGRTLACISTGRHARATQGFGPLLDGFDIVSFGDVKALKAAITPETGGIFFETIQGEGGIRPATPEFLQEARRLADAHGLLLCLDEVQCGMGRTGTLFAFEAYGVTPDICTVAKGIGGGFPLGACLASEHAAKGMTVGSHGGTYGGNPLAMAVGNAVLDCLQAPGFLAHVMETGAYLRASLGMLARDFPPLFADVRGVGLMQGLVTRASPQPIVAALRTKGLLTAAASGDQVIRLLPPLIITTAHVDEAMRILRQVAASFSSLTA